MIKRVTLTVAALAVSLAALGQSQQKFIADKVVAVVGNMPVLYSDVVEQSRRMAEQYRSEGYTSPREPLSEALETLLEQKLLYIRAQIDSIGLEAMAAGLDRAVEDNVRAMIAEAGSIKALEIERNKPLYTIRDDTRRNLEEYYGAMEMRSHVMGQVKVTPGEVDRFYRRIDRDSLPIIPEQYTYAQITRLPLNIELAKQRTRDRLLELRQRIADGDRFDNLAVYYSEDPGSALQGGELPIGPKTQWQAPFADALSKLQPGQVSGVVETDFGFHIIQLIDKPSADIYHARHIMLKPSYTNEELRGTLVFLDSLATVIRSGEITFEEAARLHSDDASSRMNGGIVSNQEALYRYTGNSNPALTRTRFNKDQLEQGDATVLIRLKEGEISRAGVGRNLTMDEMGKLLKLVQVIPAHPANLSEDWLDIEQMALARKQEAHYRTWLDDRIDETYIRIDPMFKKENFENKRWFK